LAGFLRGDFERVVRPSDVLDQAERGLLKVTEEQYACLDGLEDNARCLFEGAAGTGKTLLAMEHARRRSAKGERVLFLCFNRLLGNWLASVFGKPEVQGRIFCAPFHRYLDGIIAKSSAAEEFRINQSGSQDASLFRKTYPFFALLALEELAQEPFDVLVVDEGQDLIRPEYLDVMNSILKGGLAGGQWAMFCDFHRQAIYADATAEEMKDEIKRRAPSHARFKLSINCRNTRPIGEETAILSGFDVPPFLSSNVGGPPVEYRFSGTDAGARESLDQVLKGLIQSGIKPNSIVILSPVSYERSCALDWRGPGGISVARLEADQYPKVQGNTIFFSTIQAFKGLENSVVVLTDIDRIDDDRARALLYVGMSRARQALFILMSKKAHEQYVAAVRQRIIKVGAAR
jgi:hypothetical protein